MTRTSGDRGSPSGRPSASAVETRRQPAIDVHGLTKRYGRRTVVAGLDLTIPQGVVAGFVGPNGAGKTTTLRMLLGLIRPTAGSGTVLGQPLHAPAHYLPRIGALIESPALYPALSGARNLAALAALGGQDSSRVGPVLDQVGLLGRGADKVRTYSLGMKQRLAIGGALLNDPDLLVLDEPTNGLDPSGIRQMREFIRSLAAGRDTGPRTVLVSSHLLAEVEQICDWLIVVEGGQLAYQGPTGDLMADQAQDVVLRPEHDEDLPLLADVLAELAVRVTVRPREVVASLDGPAGWGPDDDPPTRMLARINRAVTARGITLVEMSPHRPSLEDRYQDLVALARGGTEARSHPGAGAASTDRGEVGAAGRPRSSLASNGADDPAPGGTPPRELPVAAAGTPTAPVIAAPVIAAAARPLSTATAAHEHGEVPQ